MKKLLLAILALISGTSLIADAKFNPVTQSFYSYPDTSDIDQSKYNDNFVNFLKIFEAWANHYGCHLGHADFEKSQLTNLLNNKTSGDDLSNRFNAFFSILQRESKVSLINQLTNLRFLNDLQLLNITNGFTTLCGEPYRKSGLGL